MSYPTREKPTKRKKTDDLLFDTFSQAVDWLEQLEFIDQDGNGHGERWAHPDGRTAKVFGNVPNRRNDGVETKVEIYTPVEDIRRFRLKL